MKKSEKINLDMYHVQETDKGIVIHGSRGGEKRYIIEIDFKNQTWQSPAIARACSKWLIQMYNKYLKGYKQLNRDVLA